MSLVFQKVLKGIPNLDDDTAAHIVKNGILCNWWRSVREITPKKIQLHLTGENADLHLNHYHKPVPSGNPLAALGAKRFGDVSPFISTTAGVIERDGLNSQNIFFDPFLTAMRFATDNFKTKGYIFYAYVLTIGKIAIEMEQFSEEVRELHIYKNFLPYHTQGEIMAKIIIPSVQIEKAVYYDGPAIKALMKSGKTLPSLRTIDNPDYQKPEKLSNIREVMS
ncbi:hypothetical protein ACFJIV_28900 [Mucilaginibacter sp. UC70_90]